MDRYSFLNAMHSELIEELYRKYLCAPNSVETSWRAFFQGFDFALENYGKIPELSLEDQREEKIVLKGSPVDNSQKILKELQVTALIEAYRIRGHLFTKTNPVRNRRDYSPNLDIERFGLSQLDLNTVFEAAKIIGKEPLPLFKILAHLKLIYCQSIGVEYMYIRDPEKIEWIHKWLTKNDNSPYLLDYEKKNLLNRLNQAVVFENFLHTNFVGQKRFSIEGNESLLPALDELINYASNVHQAEEFVIGMAHRGRLNVLTNVFKKSPAEIFSEFDGKEYQEVVFAGDVKYHLGATTTLENRQGKSVRIHLAPNPSHLEAVDPVMQGIARANIDSHHEGNSLKLLPILVHGDAAIAAQGIVYEMVQMAQLKGYTTGGTIHIVVNNQIGFTTNYLDGRSSTYCTDVAKITLSPVLHVNADDVEAVIHAIRFAVDFRMRFQQDVFIDLLGYRKYGHNEGDEPRFTQPSLYKAIEKHPNARDSYAMKLQKEGIVGEKYVSVIENDFKNQLEKDYEISRNIELSKLDPFLEDQWKGFKMARSEELLKNVDTSFSLEKLREIGLKISTLPKEGKFYRKIEKLFEQRVEMMKKGNALNWSMAELLAYGSLLDEGFDVRLSGEDVERGTFSHRHAVVLSEDTEDKYVLLNTIANPQASMRVYNSPLSEYGVMGFDYGYAMAAPNTLTLWEAQFGDFSNGAQIIIDQYLSAAEDKWKTQNGLVLLLPHGYEGQGSEHSSARIERYLQLCGRNNMFVLNCSSPANFYHALRRHMKFSFRKPLIVFTPKSLLRHGHCTSTLKELATGSFQLLIDDNAADVEKISRVVICSGKIYYELFEQKKALKSEHIAIVRLEQFHPLPEEELEKIFKKYKFCQQWIWAQEEPENMGGWFYISSKIKNFPLKLVARSESASPASGSYRYFLKTQQEIINKVFKS